MNAPVAKAKHGPWRVNRRLLDFCRTVHVYFTMLGLLVLLLFGFTGFTLNHEDWFGAGTPRVQEIQGKIPADLLKRGDTLRIVENLRQNYHVTGSMTSFDDLDERYSAAFRSPGESWDVEIEKTTGDAAIRIEAYNFIAVLNNLHRGQYTGFGWRVIIDACAVLIVLACVTGLVLWLALPKRRMIGTAAFALGTIGALLVYLFLVPGKDEAKYPPPSASSSGEKVTAEPAP